MTASRGPLQWLDRAFVAALVWLIRGYQLCLSPWLGRQCRFHPTCSEYGIEALKRHGTLRGSGLLVWRILRCQPLARGGFDAVPARPHDSLNHECSHHATD